MIFENGVADSIRVSLTIALYGLVLEMFACDTQTERRTTRVAATDVPTWSWGRNNRHTYPRRETLRHNAKTQKGNALQSSTLATGNWLKLGPSTRKLLGYEPGVNHSSCVLRTFAGPGLSMVCSQVAWWMWSDTQPCLLSRSHYGWIPGYELLTLCYVYCLLSFLLSRPALRAYPGVCYREDN